MTSLVHVAGHDPFPLHKTRPGLALRSHHFSFPFPKPRHGRQPLERRHRPQGSHNNSIQSFLSILIHPQVINVLVYLLFLGSNISTIFVPTDIYFKGKETYLTPAPWAFLIWSVSLILYTIHPLTDFTGP